MSLIHCNCNLLPHCINGGGDVIPSKSQSDELTKTIMDQYDLDEVMPDCFNFDAANNNLTTSEILMLIMVLTFCVD
jgi:hypothetical protein